MDKKTTYMRPITNKEKIALKVIPNSKHNRWIEGMEAGESFFMWIMNFGYGFIFLVCAITSALYLIELGLTHPAYLGIVVLLLQILRFGVFMMLIGFFLMYLCRWWAKHLYKKELHTIEEEAYGRKKEKSIQKNN